jgi:DNA mismatch repair ATPase MutS
MTEQQEKKILSIKERLLKQKKPQWAINLINEYIDLKEDELDDKLIDLKKRLIAIDEEYYTKFRDEVKKEISEFEDDMIDWRNGSYLDTDEISYDDDN